MPIDNWIGLHDDSDITRLSKTGKICKRANVAYEKIEASFIDTFGAGKDFLLLQQKRIELELMYCKQIHTDDFSTQLFIDLLEKEIKQLTEKNSSLENKVMNLVPWVESEMHISIDTKKTTVFEFYNRVNFIIKKNSMSNTKNAKK